MIRGNAVSMTGHVVKGELNKISFEEVKMSTSEVEISGHFGLAISFMEKKPQTCHHKISIEPLRLKKYVINSHTFGKEIEKLQTQNLYIYQSVN